MSDTEENDQYTIDLERLRNTIPLNSLSDTNLATLIEDSKIGTLPKGKVIFKEGSSDTLSVYLLEGEVELASKDLGTKRVITADTDEATYALAQLRPRQYTGKTTGKTRIAQIDSLQIDRLLTMDQLSEDWGSADGLEVDELSIDIDGEWMMEMLRVKHDQAETPPPHR